jgi:hypothetical protein
VVTDVSGVLTRKNASTQKQTVKEMPAVLAMASQETPLTAQV